MTTEEALIVRYFAAFNGHDIDAVMACFHDHPVVVDMDGRRFEGPAEVRRHYEAGFAGVPDGWCDLQRIAANEGRGMAESVFRGTTARSGRAITALGVEVIDIAEGKIKEIRDYHRLVD
jgi:hypothetical protein